MGVGRIFSRWGTRGFFQNFSRNGAKSGEIWFFPLETKKTTSLCRNFQYPGGSYLPPSDVHDFWFYSIFSERKLELQGLVGAGTRENESTHDQLFCNQSQNY